MARTEGGGMMIEAIASGAGYTIRALLVLVRNLPGIVGPLAVAYGAWLAYEPAGYIVIGLVLWLADVLATRPRPAPVRSDE